MNTFKRGLREFQDTKKEVIEETCLGRTGKTDYQIYGADKLNNDNNPFSLSGMTKITKICELEPPPSDLPKRYIQTVFENKIHMEKLKRKAVETYKDAKLFMNIIEIRISRKALMSEFLVVTRRMEISGKMYALSQYVTWMYMDFVEDPVEKMRNKSIVYICHQDPFLVNDLLKDIAQVFRTVLELDSTKDLQQLIDNVALLQYEFSHAMPFRRGSAAIGEWLEETIYRYHGYKAEYNEGISVNLEALCSPLGEFVRNYSTMLKLKKI